LQGCFSHDFIYNATVLNLAFIQAAFIFTIGGMFFIALQSGVSNPVMAQTSQGNRVVADQQSSHQVQPIAPSRPAQQMGMQRPLRVKPTQEVRNEIIERRSEQIKREDFSRNLERRRQRLRQERVRSRP
jgi:hypothetical protein